MNAYIYFFFLCAPDAASVWTWQPLTCHGLRHVMDQNHSKPPPKPLKDTQRPKMAMQSTRLPMIFYPSTLTFMDAFRRMPRILILTWSDGFPLEVHHGKFSWFSMILSPISSPHGPWLTDSLFPSSTWSPGRGERGGWLEGKAIVGCLSGFPFLDVGLGRRQGRLKVGQRPCWPHPILGMAIS